VVSGGTGFSIKGPTPIKPENMGVERVKNVGSIDFLIKLSIFRLCILLLWMTSIYRFYQFPVKRLFRELSKDLELKSIFSKVKAYNFFCLNEKSSVAKKWKLLGSIADPH